MPGWFTGRLYKEPERYPIEIARERRLAATLDRARKELEERSSPLSLANKVHLDRLKEFQAKFAGELDARRREIERLRKLESSMDNSRRLVAAMSGLFQLKARRAQLLENVARTRRAQVLQAAAADGRFFQFGDSFNPRTVFNTVANLSVRSVGRRAFRNPALTIPCVQRVVRREVMFAKGKAGIGHKVRHKFNLLSTIGC